MLEVRDVAGVPLDPLAYSLAWHVTDVIDALLPGDANGDGWVDGLDYLVWAGNFGSQPGPDGDVSDGDFNDDGTIDGLDYLLWAGNFGTHSATTVPEPTALALSSLGVLGTLLLRRRAIVA
ncbi:MAG: PEP-CTERM sorting domain-containing protein [Pirellulales bacterium]